jgi:hypothetical protein
MLYFFSSFDCFTIDTDNYMNTEKFLSNSNMNWPVQKVPLAISKNGNRRITSYYHIVRGDKGNVLGSCTDARQLKQNSDVLAEITKAIKGTGLTISDGSPIDKAGKHIAFNLRSKDPITLIQPFEIPGDRKLTANTHVIYHHDSGKYETQNSFTFHILDGDDIKVVIHSQYNDDLSTMIKKSLEYQEEIIGALFKMKDTESTTKIEYHLAEFLINPNNSKWTAQKYSAKAELINIINKRTYGTCMLSLFLSVCQYASTSSSIKDRETSLHIGKVHDIMNRAFLYLKEESEN